LCGCIEIAALARIVRKGAAWIVPSQSGKGRYTVVPDADAPHCTCPDHETRGVKCKHIHAVAYVIERDRNADGTTTVTETSVAVQQTVRKVYPQNCPAYNAAQTNEKDRFLDLLHDLCQGVSEPVRQKNGRPRLPIQDAIFAPCYKVYSTVSCRRFMSDLRDAQAKASFPTFRSEPVGDVIALQFIAYGDSEPEVFTNLDRVFHNLTAVLTEIEKEMSAATVLDR
jgi:SWIM zinc finger